MQTCSPSPRGDSAHGRCVRRIAYTSRHVPDMLNAAIARRDVTFTRVPALCKCECTWSLVHHWRRNVSPRPSTIHPSLRHRLSLLPTLVRRNEEACPSSPDVSFSILEDVVLAGASQLSLRWVLHWGENALNVLYFIWWERMFPIPVADWIGQLLSAGKHYKC